MEAIGLAKHSDSVVLKGGALAALPIRGVFAATALPKAPCALLDFALALGELHSEFDE